MNSEEIANGMQRYFNDKGIISRSKVLQIGGSIILAQYMLERFTNAKIWSYELKTDEKEDIVLKDARFSRFESSLRLAEYDVIIFVIPEITKIESYLVPYLARYIFICGVPEGDLAKHIIARCQYFGYTSLKHDDNILYAQFLYKATKYPRATLTDKFPYHHEATPDGIGAWMSHKEINTLMEEGKDKIYLEIGTYDGFSAHMMAKVAKKVICIDPYDTAPGRLGQVMRNTIYPNIEKLVNITGYSQCAEWIFKDNLVDVLVIDGDHHVEAVKRDYAMYRRLVKVGGIIAFHDYGNFPTVGFAVDNCVKVDEHYKSVETLVLFKKTDKSL